MSALARCLVPAAIAATSLALVAPTATGCTTEAAAPAQSQPTAAENGVTPVAAKYQTAAARPSGKLNTVRIEQLTGLKGKLNEKENVFKVSYPRMDIDLTVAGAKVTPPFGTTAWVAFTPAMGGVMAMGDLVMTEDQVNAVMSEALNDGLQVTALHNHFFWDNPKVYFMHIGGMGDETKVASAVGKVFARLKATSGGKGAVPRASIRPDQTTLDSKALDGIVGAKGDLANGVLKYTIGKTTRMSDGMEVGNAMGVNTWAAIMGTSAQAVVDGDFAMYDDEVQSVLKTLRAGNINVVAIHNHMIGETPRVTFLHYWGVGPAADLARTFKAALEKTRFIPPTAPTPEPRAN